MPDDIKWPQKVTRYRIQCPFQRLLIAKHESQIDWSGHRIENGEALDGYLRQVMLPGLKDCIMPDHPKSHYCKSIHLERMLANPAPHINEARQIRQRDGDEAARQFLLGHINQHKKEHFEGWWRYLMEENPLYAQHPAFQYLVLRPVLEGSTAKDTRTPLPVDAEALAHLFDRMRAGRVAPGTKLLSVLSEIMAFGAKAAGDGKRPSFGTDCRWVVVKRQDANAANRVAALSQGSGWCVASSEMADYYLGDSDFHLLVEGGRAKVALRLSKNQAVEVQGHGNRDPGPWWPRILLYCAARGTQITDYRRDAARSEAESIRQELVAAQRTTRQLGELLKAQPAKVHLVSMPEELDDASRLVVQEAWLVCVRADPLCGGLLPGWMEADPAVKQATLEAWIALVRSDPQSYAAVPGALAQEPRILAALRVGWMELLRRVTRWNQCPEFLQLEFRQDGGFIQTFKMGWMELLNRDVTKWTTCPEFLQKDEEVIQALKIGWRTLLKRDVTKWNACPEFLQKDDDLILAHKTVWINEIKRDVTQWGLIPEFLRKDEEVIHACKKGWMDLLKLDVTHWQEIIWNLETNYFKSVDIASDWTQYPDFLEQDAQISQGLRTVWIRLLKNNELISLPDDYYHYPEIYCPRFLLRDAEVIAARKIGWIKVLKENKPIWWLDFPWRDCPEFLRQDAEVILARKEGWINLLRRDVTHWNRCPEFLQQDKEVIQALKIGWRTLLKRDVTKWTKCPEFLQKDVWLIWVIKTEWTNLLKCDVSRWNQCPEFLQQEFRQDGGFFQTVRTGWVDLLNRDVAKWNQCPEFLREDEEVIQARRKGWMNLLKRDVTKWYACPEFLRTEFRQAGEFIQKYRMGWVDLLKRNIAHHDACPAFLERDGELIHAMKTGWIKRIKCDVTHWNICPKLLQQNEEVIRACKDGWMGVLKCNATKWNQCPEFLQRDEEVIQARKMGWIDQLKRDVTKWTTCPDFLQKEEEVIQSLKIGWMELLKRDVSWWNQCPDDLHKPVWMEWLNHDPEKWDACPETLKQDQDVIDSWRSGWISWLRQQDPERQKIWMAILLKRNVLTPAHENAFWMTVNEGGDYLHPTQISTAAAANQQLPPLPSDPLPAYAAASFKVLLQEPQATLSIVQGWKHSPRLELARCAQALALLKQQPWNFSTLPADQQSHPLIHEAAVQGWGGFVTKHPHFLDQVPESLCTHPKLQTTLTSLREAEKKALAKQVLEEVKKRPGLSDEAMSELHLPAKDKQMWKQVTALRLKHWKKQVRADARAWERMPKSLQQDEDILKLMREGLGPQIRQKPALWNQLPACYQNDPCLQRVHRFATRA